jgi:putative ABC transport system permease protein
MLFWTTVKIVLRSLVVNKMRSILSMLGIIIGVGAVIALLAVGAGAQKTVLSHVTALGSNLIMVNPGQSKSGGVRSTSFETLKPEDADAIYAAIPQVIRMSPISRGNGQFKYYNKNKQASIMGVTSTYIKIRNFEIDRGRAFTQGEIEQRAKVAILGSDVAKDLFGDANPLDEKVKVKGVAFKVIAVLKSKGTQGPFSFDDQALVPCTTAMDRMLGVDYLSEIDLQMEDGADQTAVQAAVEELLRKRHRIPEGKDSDFQVRNMAEMVAAVTSVTNTFSLLLGSVAAISLIVGGIGIMNIMLVTVTERTREIGIRKAIGADDRDILIQFLLESIVMSALGGVLGIALGGAVAAAITLIAGFTAPVTPASIALSLSFAICVGVFFGFYPARRAASLDPIEALSYE